jgi:hypothetical protein
VAGRKRRITIGYADKTTLAQARKEALQTLAAMRGGGGPHRRTKGASTGIHGPKHHHPRTV